MNTLPVFPINQPVTATTSARPAAPRGRRYRTTGDWSRVDTTPVAAWDDEPLGSVVIEVADVVDTRCGDTYRGGARRVTVLAVDGTVRSRSKTFIGESAWAEARRYADDAVWELQRS